jgi:integrase
MRGSIRKRGDSYQVVVSGGFDPVTRKRVQHYFTAHTPEDAEKELTRLLRALDTGSVSDPGKLTFGRYVVDQWLPHAESRVRARTLRRYRELMQRHILPTLGRVKLAKLRPAHIQSMIDAMPTGPRTKVHAYRVCSASLRHAVKVNLINSNPAAGATPPRPPRPSLTVPTADDVNRLIDASDGWLRASLVLAASTGMRRGEILGLQWRAVNLDRRTAEVNLALENLGSELRFVQPKTDRSRRTVALPMGAVTFLRGVRADQAERRLLLGSDWTATDLVVERGDGKPIHPDLLSARFAGLAAKLGLADVRLHDFRHFYASELLRRNVHPKVVSEGLGHSSTSFTMDTYSHLLPSMQEQAADAIEASLFGERR